MKRAMTNRASLLAPGFSQCDGIEHSKTVFSGFQNYVAQGGKPLKRFSHLERSDTRLKPGANERPAAGVLMKMKYDC
jgi:hypothetical protein